MVKIWYIQHNNINLLVTFTKLMNNVMAKLWTENIVTLFMTHSVLQHNIFSYNLVILTKLS